jgi:hypothetical protein
LKFTFGRFLADELTGFIKFLRLTETIGGIVFAFLSKSSANLALPACSYYEEEPLKEHELVTKEAFFFFFVSRSVPESVISSSSKIVCLLYFFINGLF